MNSNSSDNRELLEMLSKLERKLSMRFGEKFERTEIDLLNLRDEFDATISIMNERISDIDQRLEAIRNTQISQINHT